jgi:hypothetical protein
MSVTSIIMGRLWRLEHDLARRAILPFAVFAVVLLRLCGLILAPLTIVLILVFEMAKAAGEVMQGTLVAVCDMTRAEPSEWAKLKRAVSMVWATAFDKRPQPVLMRGDSAIEARSGETEGLDPKDERAGAAPAEIAA